MVDNGLFSGDVCPLLTAVEREVLDLITKEYYTIKQVCIRRNCSRQAVHKIVKRLKTKGFLSVNNEVVDKVDKNLSTLKKGVHLIRLHGMEFNIRLLFRSDKYFRVLGKGNVLSVDDNTVRLFKDSIEVYGKKSFFASTAHKATVRAFSYWDRFFSRLEHELGVVIVKPRSNNIRLVNNHYAEVNNELSSDCYDKSERIMVFARDDGRLWFTIDNSLDLREAEALHPETAKRDMGDVVAPFFNDLRDNKVFLPSDLQNLIGKVQTQLVELSSAQLNTHKQLDSILSLIKPVSSKVDDDVFEERSWYHG